MANGYFRGALEFAAGAWLTEASDSHVDFLDREARRGSRGRPRRTPSWRRQACRRPERGWYDLRLAQYQEGGIEGVQPGGS